MPMTGPACVVMEMRVKAKTTTAACSAGPIMMAAMATGAAKKNRMPSLTVSAMQEE